MMAHIELPDIAEPPITPGPCSAQTAPITINTPATISMTIFIRNFFRPGTYDVATIANRPSAIN